MQPEKKISVPTPRDWKTTRTAILGIAAIVIVVTIGYKMIYANNPFREIFSVSDTIINPNSMQRRLLNRQQIPAPAITGIQQWLNTPDGQTLQLADLRGKVVLVDFWTYSCINCIRTLPFITEWDRKYRDKGLVIIGVHTPEFNFEKSPDNVLAAIDKYNIEYPVALDNDYQTWRAYRNNFWPAKYFIDHHGNIVWQHFGEGAYAESEQVIQQLLRDAGLLDSEMPTTALESEVDFQSIGTPEIYFGYGRISHFGQQATMRPDRVVHFTEPQTIASNTFYLVGDWNIQAEHAELVNGPGKIIIRYKAKQANIVLTADQPTHAEVRLDGGFLDETNRGQNVVLTDGVSTVNVQQDDLYNFTATSDAGEHVLEVSFPVPGVWAFAFTFG